MKKRFRVFLLSNINPPLRAVHASLIDERFLLKRSPSFRSALLPAPDLSVPTVFVRLAADANHGGEQTEEKHVFFFYLLRKTLFHFLSLRT